MVGWWGVVVGVGWPAAVALIVGGSVGRVLPTGRGHCMKLTSVTGKVYKLVASSLLFGFRCAPPQKIQNIEKLKLKSLLYKFYTL